MQSRQNTTGPWKMSSNFYLDPNGPKFGNQRRQCNEEAIENKEVNGRGVEI
jgi:hypothetical protein